jgi:adenosylmethionine-8-amino-7-oxononanoate aminotransferase
MLAPPFIISEAEIAELVHRLDRSIGAVLGAA